jgi:hypothetical protein
MTKEEHLAYLNSLPTPPAPPSIRRKAKPAPPKLEVASIAEPSIDVLRDNVAKAQDRLFVAEKAEAEHRSCKPVENMRRYGRAQGPLPADEARLLRFQTGVDFAKETERRARMLQRLYWRQLNEYGQYGEDTMEELVERQNRR